MNLEVHAQGSAGHGRDKAVQVRQVLVAVPTQDGDQLAGLGDACRLAVSAADSAASASSSRPAASAMRAVLDCTAMLASPCPTTSCRS